MQVANEAGSVLSDPAALLVNTAPSLGDQIGRCMRAVRWWLRCRRVIRTPPQVLNFSLETAPAGATIDPGTGTIQWTPGWRRRIRRYPYGMGE